MVCVRDDGRLRRRGSDRRRIAVGWGWEELALALCSVRAAAASCRADGEHSAFPSKAPRSRCRSALYCGVSIEARVLVNNEHWLRWTAWAAVSRLGVARNVDLVQRWRRLRRATGAGSGSVDGKWKKDKREGVDREGGRRRGLYVPLREGGVPGGGDGVGGGGGVRG